MASVPEPTKTTLTQSLQAHAHQHWPQLADLQVRFRGQFAYLDAELTVGGVLPLCRLRYLGSTQVWGFGLYLASSDNYEDQILPTGSFTGPAPRRSTAPAASTSPDPPSNPQGLSAQTT